MNRFTSLMAIIEAEDEACRNVYKWDKQIEKLYADERKINENPFECDAKELDLDKIRTAIGNAHTQRNIAERDVDTCRIHLRQYLNMLGVDVSCQG